MVVVGGTAGSREVVADDQRVGSREQPHALQLAEHALAPAGQAQPRAGQDQPEQRDGLQGFARAQRLVLRRAGCRAGVEEVDRHLARVELRELEREVDALLERLAHAEDAAAAQLHARITPASCAVATRSSYEWVVHTWGNSARHVSRLWL